MPNKLKPNQKFIPCEQALDDEMFPNGIFLFNITRLLEHLRSEHSDIPISDVRVADFPRFSSSLDEAHIDTVDLEKPVVIAEIAPQRYNVIDGHHRMERARRESVTELPCYRVPPEVHTLFLCSKEAYDSYIDYWNGKVDEL